MALGEIMAKGLVVIKGDTAHARAEIAKLSAEEQKAAKARIKAQEEHNAALERSNQRFQLYAAGAVAGWALISSSVKKYEEHLVSLGSKGESELKRIQSASKELTNAQNSLQYAIAKVALEAAPAAQALGKMATELANIVGGIAGVVAKAKQLPGGRVIGGALGWVVDNAGPVNMSLTAGSAMVDAGRNIYNNIRNTGTISDTSDVTGPSPMELQARQAQWAQITGKTSASQSLLGEEGRQAIQYIDQESGRLIKRTLMGKAERFFTNAGRGLGIVESNRPKGGGGGAAGGAAPSAYQMAMWQLGNQANNDERLRMLMDEQVAADEFGSFGFLNEKRNVDAPNPWTSVAPPQSLLDDLDALMGEQRESMLEKIFGPVSDFELYSTAWQGLETVVSAGFDAWISGSKSVGEAMKEALHGFAKNLAGEALMQALRHTAYGIGSLAFPDPASKISAAQHFKAAAAWGAVAVVAGGVGKATAPSAGAGGGAGRGNSYAAAGIGGGSGGGGGSSQGPTYIVLGDSYGYESERSRNQRFRSALHTSSRGGGPSAGVQHS